MGLFYISQTSQPPAQCWARIRVKINYRTFEALSGTLHKDKKYLKMYLNGSANSSAVGRNVGASGTEVEVSILTVSLFEFLIACWRSIMSSFSYSSMSKRFVFERFLCDSYVRCELVFSFLS